MTAEAIQVWLSTIAGVAAAGFTVHKYIAKSVVNQTFNDERFKELVQNVASLKEEIAVLAALQERRKKPRGGSE